MTCSLLPTFWGSLPSQETAVTVGILVTHAKAYRFTCPGTEKIICVTHECQLEALDIPKSNSSQFHSKLRNLIWRPSFRKTSFKTRKLFLNHFFQGEDRVECFDSFTTLHHVDLFEWIHRNRLDCSLEHAMQRRSLFRRSFDLRKHSQFMIVGDSKESWDARDMDTVDRKSLLGKFFFIDGVGLWLEGVSQGASLPPSLRLSVSDRDASSMILTESPKIRVWTFELERKKLSWRCECRHGVSFSYCNHGR